MKESLPLFVGFDMANMAGLVDVESLRASNTCKIGQHKEHIEEKKVSI